MSETQTVHPTREARLASLTAATGGTLPTVLLELVEGYAAFCTFVLFHPSHHRVQRFGAVEEGPAFVFAPVAPGKDLQPCMAHVGGNVYAVYKKGLGSCDESLGARVCAIGGTGDAKKNSPPFAWKEVAPPPITWEIGTLYVPYRFHALGGRLFLFERALAGVVGEVTTRVYEYEPAADAWTQGAATAALARFSELDPRGAFVATETVLYLFASDGPCYAFGIRTCTWRRLYNWHDVFPRKPSRPPLALPRNGFLFLLTGRLDRGILPVARYLGDDSVDVAGSRWQHVLWKVPRPAGGHVDFMGWWVEPFDNRLYLALLHSSPAQQRRAYAWSRSLRMAASEAVPLDCFMEPSYAAWTPAWTREYEGDYFEPALLLSHLTTLSSGPPPGHAMEHLDRPPPPSFARTPAFVSPE